MNSSAQNPGFTVLFEGDVRQFIGNPFRTDTPFGKPRAIGLGNEFERRDLLEQALQEIAGQDVTEIALDPDWPRRIAEAALDNVQRSPTR